MEQLKTAALMLLYVSAAGFIYQCLLPSGKVGDTAKRVLSVVIMAILIVPVVQLKDNEFFKPSAVKQSIISEPSEVLKVLSESAQKKIEDLIEKTVKEYTDISYEIRFTADISEDGRIDIKQVLVEFEQKPEKINDISLALEKALGTTPEIRVKKNE